MESRKLLWIGGRPCSGKTFIGDYLESRGDWHHIDGDQGNQTTEPILKGKWSTFTKAVMDRKTTEGPEVNKELWRPYSEHLITQYKKAMEDHPNKNIVLSFALLNIFHEKDWIREQIDPNLKYVVIDVTKPELLKRNVTRNRKIFEAAGTSEEEVWGKDMMQKSREKYGEEYSPERFAKMMEEQLFELECVGQRDDHSWYTNVTNENIEEFEGIKKMDEMLGLESMEIDAEAIAQVNYDRMKNLNLDMDVIEVRSPLS